MTIHDIGHVRSIVANWPGNNVKVSRLGAAHKLILSCITSNGRLEGGGKRNERFQNICFFEISSENILQETMFLNFRLLYDF